MNCEIPRLTVSTWRGETKLAGPTYRKIAEQIKSMLREGQVIAVIGQPGTGKTTLLRKLSEEVKPSIYLDMANKKGLAEEFWAKFEPTQFRAELLKSLEAEKKRFGYSFFKKLFGVNFEDHLLSVCKKYDDPRLRLFCNSYSRDFDGMLKALNDYSAVFGKPTLFVDETRENHAEEILRFVNSGLGVPMIFAMPTDSYSRITDLAIRRRIEESRISLDYVLTEEDIYEIINAYCPSFARELTDLAVPLWKGREIVTVSQLLNYARQEFENASSQCKDEECIRKALVERNIFKDLPGLVRAIESTVREGLSSLKEKYGITYVHMRGKRVEVKDKHTVVDFFFITNGEAYVGDLRIFTGSPTVDQDLNMLREVTEVEHEKVKYPVRARFLLTNADLELDGVKTVRLDTHELIRASKGDREVILSKLLDSLELDEVKTTGEATAQV